mgnify:CR=1 FL=1
MMDQMQNDQPAYREPTEEDDIECSEECTKAYCRGMNFWYGIVRLYREQYHIDKESPIPSACWMAMSQEILCINGAPTVLVNWQKLPRNPTPQEQLAVQLHVLMSLGKACLKDKKEAEARPRAWPRPDYLEDMTYKELVERAAVKQEEQAAFVAREIATDTGTHREWTDAVTRFTYAKAARVAFDKKVSVRRAAAKREGAAIQTATWAERVDKLMAAAKKAREMRAAKERVKQAATTRAAATEVGAADPPGQERAEALGGCGAAAPTKATGGPVATPLIAAATEGGAAPLPEFGVAAADQGLGVAAPAEAAGARAAPPPIAAAPEDRAAPLPEFAIAAAAKKRAATRNTAANSAMRAARSEAAERSTLVEEAARLVEEETCSEGKRCQFWGWPPASFTTWSVEFYTKVSQSARTLYINRVNRRSETGQVLQKTGQVSPKSGQVPNMPASRMYVFPHNSHHDDSNSTQQTGQVFKKRVRLA